MRTARASIDVGSGKISFDISGTPYSFKFRPKGEECHAIDEVRDTRHRGNVASKVIGGDVWIGRPSYMNHGDKRTL